MGETTDSRQLILRPVQPNDAAALHAIISDERVARTLTHVPSMEISETEEWIQKLQPGQHRLVAESKGQVVGFGNLRQMQNPRLAHTGRVGLYVHPDFWGQGIGTTLMAGLLDLADNWLNLSRVELGVFSQHQAAIHLYEKVGFEKEGLRQATTFGQGHFQDEFLMARLRHLDPNPPWAEVSQPAQPRGSALANLLIRPLRPEDSADLNACFRHPLVSRTTLQMPSLEMSKTVERYKSYVAGIHRFVAESERRAIGMVSIHCSPNPRLAHSGGLGMMVHPDYWGRGVATALMEKVLDLADNWLNLKRVDLDVNCDNPAAIHLYKKFAFTVEGVKRYHVYGSGRWSHSYFMARLKT